MVLKLLIISTLFYIAVGQKYTCNSNSALNLLKRPAYEFSMRILDRVTHNNYGHYVFSPLSTWLQLIALAEGAEGRTLRELWNVTKHHRNRCFKNKLGRLISKHTSGLDEEYRRKSLIIIDKYMDVRKSYAKKVLRFYGVEVVLKDFDYPEICAMDVNNLVAESTNGVIDESVFFDDFNKTVMLLSDNVYFKSAWKYPFDEAFTKKESFKSNIDTHLGDVNMMNYVGYLNTAEMRHINAKVLEIPCGSNFSMLVLLPLKRNWIGDIYFNMKQTRLISIFNKFRKVGKKLVHVKLPRFRINSTVDNLAELMVDMGVKSIFHPSASFLPHISKYDLYVSLMTQVADIEVTEKGVKASAASMSQLNDTAEKIEFFADRPFAYMIVERKTQFILFAGTYSVPSVY